MPLPALFVGRWLLAEQPETLMQWFAVIGLFRGTSGFLLGQATQCHRHLSTIFHVTTQHRGKWEAACYIEDHISGSQNRAQAAWCVCVWKGLNQRVSAGAIPVIIGGWPTKRSTMRAVNVLANF